MLPSASSLEGKSVPHVIFKTQNQYLWQDVSTDDIFKGQTVVLFSLRGAFTPTCSSTHQPRYNELAGVFKENGVDRIVCVAVNDAFVMNQWKQDQDAENISLLPDGNGEFTAAMGLLVDLSKFGFGKRSWRYSMLVKDGVIEKMFIEPEKEGDPLEVSDADSMLAYLNPQAVAPAAVTIFAKPGCPHCARAKALLDADGYRYSEISQGKLITASTLRAVSGSGSWPQVFIDGKLIGGAGQLETYFHGHQAQAENELATPKQQAQTQTHNEQATREHQAQAHNELLTREYQAQNHNEVAS